MDERQNQSVILKMPVLQSLPFDYLWRPARKEDIDCGLFTVQVNIWEKGWKFLKKLWCCVGGGSKVIWLYQLSWKCKLATVMSYKADVSSVSPSSERISEKVCLEPGTSGRYSGPSRTPPQIGWYPIERFGHVFPACFAKQKQNGVCMWGFWKIKAKRCLCGKIFAGFYQKAFLQDSLL